MVASALIFHVSFGSRSPHGSFATDERWLIASTPSRFIVSISRTSPCTTVSLGSGFRKLPNHMMSNATTSCPAASNLGTRTVPLYPQAPVTKIFIARLSPDIDLGIKTNAQLPELAAKQIRPCCHEGVA